MSRTKGFTLLEVIIAIVIASIVASIFAPSLLQKTRTRATETFAGELAEMVEGLKRYYWANDNFPATLADLVSFMNLPVTPTSPIGGALSYTATSSAATITLSGVTGSKQKYLSIIDRIVPFSTCNISTGTCTITVPATSVYIDQEIRAVAIVNPGDPVPPITCPSGMTPEYVVSVLFAQDPSGYGIAGFKAYVDSGQAVLEIKSVSGNTVVAGASDGKLEVLAFCH